MTASQDIVKGNILLIDDDTGNLKMLTRILTKAGFTVKASSSGRHALKYVEEFSPDIILLDIIMDGLDGFQVARLLKTDPLSEHIPVIFISGLMNEENKVKAFQEGGVDYITKPFFTQEVVARVRTHILNSRMQHTLEDMVSKRTSELTNAEKEITKYSENLEAMVKERTEKLEMTQKKLIRQEKLAAIGSLSGSVAHDLRNPLGAISNSIYFLRAISKNEPNEKILKHISIMEQEIQRVKIIIDDLIDFSRDNSPILSSGDVNELIRNYVDEQQLDKNVMIKIQLDTALPSFLFDHTQMRRVLDNLVTNSIQAMPDGGSVQLVTRYVAPNIEIEVRDNGVGIIAGNMKYIFEPLFTTKAKGVGLGLSIVKNFVEKHGGSVEVESVVDKGTTFTVKLSVKSNQSWD